MEIGNDTVIALDLAWQIAIGLVVVASCYFSIKFGLNGMKDRSVRMGRSVEEIRLDVKQLLASDAEQDERIGRIEAVQTAHKGWIRRVEEQKC